ncbi:hypothetical protein [Kitasatospora sp. GP82]|uniref:hypothetical protein n=1 Tax=Kitasatospora sp. GP82 TaxID=3035089 RepID=UPI0024754CC3|nr:hypothetical protein [Kitasatospora sp. GP82]MDH6125157.1 hypothetical protein [Kitasatospora sp. GP82]
MRNFFVAHEAIDAGFAALVAPGPEPGTLAEEWLADTRSRLARLARTPAPTATASPRPASPT